MSEVEKDVASFVAKEWARLNVTRAENRDPAVFGAMAAQVYLGAMKALRQSCAAEDLIAELIAQPALCEMQQEPLPHPQRFPRSCRETCQHIRLMLQEQLDAIIGKRFCVVFDHGRTRPF